MASTDPSCNTSPSVAVSQWNFIWRLPIQPRIAHFLWRASHDCLPTAENLRKRTLSDGVCVLCGESNETLRHCFFDCHIPKGVRLADPQFDGWEKLSSISLKDMMLTIIERDGLDVAGFCATLLWHIWKARCAAIFEGSPIYITQLCTHAQNQFDEYIAATRSAIIIQQKMCNPGRWSPPPVGWVKCNVDGSIKDGKSAVAGILRDHTGEILMCYSEGLNVEASYNSAALVEAFAMNVGLTVAYNLGVSQLILESDSQALVAKLNDGDDDCSVLGTMVEDLRSFSRCFNNFSVSFVKRTGNFPAHLLAQFGLGLSSRREYVHDIPGNVLVATATDNS